MRIAVLAHLKFPIAQPFAGGLERHTHLLTRLLKERGHAVTLFAATGSDRALMPIEVCPPTGEAFGDAIRHAAIEKAEFAAYAAMMESIADGGFDIVHNNSLHNLPLRLSGSIATPMLTVLHTPPFESLADGARSAHGTSYVAVSRALLNPWRPLISGADVVGNGIDLAAFPFRADPGLDAPLFWSGRIVPEKGLHLAIDAARSAGLPLAFAGPRPNEAYWNHEIAPRLGSDTIDRGHLGETALAAQIGSARVVLVTPCWEEPFGLVVAEALACGTPVAGFRRGALPDLLDLTCGRLAPPDDVEGLAAAIMEAAPLDRAACRARAEALFDANAMVSRYEQLYRSRIGVRADRDLRSAPVRVGAAGS